MNHETILANDANGVRTITLNRPEDMNSVDERMTTELQAELKAIGKDRTIRCLVLTGAGRAFCAGQDLKSVAQRQGPFDFKAALERRYNPIISRLRSLEIPVIACINGVAAGAGWSLALACDLRIAARSAKFVGAFSRIGLVPDSGMTWVLPRLVGYAKALEIAWLGDPISAEEAVRLGLVNRVVEPEQLADETKKLAEGLARSATRGLGLTKRAINSALSNDLDQQLAYEAQLQAIAGQTADYAEGVKAFIEKRQPEFRGE